MNKKITMALVLVAASSLIWADETTDQLKAQLQKVEKRVDGLEKGAKQAQDITVELKKQLGELTASGKLQQQKLNEMSSKIAALEGKAWAQALSMQLAG